MLRQQRRPARRASALTSGWRRRSRRCRGAPAPSRWGPSGTPAGSAGVPCRAPWCCARARSRRAAGRSRRTTTVRAAARRSARSAGGGGSPGASSDSDTVSGRASPRQPSASQPAGVPRSATATGAAPAPMSSVAAIPVRLGELRRRAADGAVDVDREHGVRKIVEQGLQLGLCSCGALQRPLERPAGVAARRATARRRGRRRHRRPPRRSPARSAASDRRCRGRSTAPRQWRRS